jgi:coproporphyrinogen III oxidase-like Fe-S oxidoreductase
MDNQRISYIRNLKEYIDRMDTGEDLIDERETVTPLERAVEYIMLAMRMTNGISEKEYRTKTQCDWRPIIGVLKIFEEKGWAVQEEDRWHFTVPGFLISNTLIGIMLEAQTTGRVDSIPWMREAYKVESRIALPSTEDEIFKEIYRQQVAKKKF